MNRARWIGFLCLGITALGWGLNWPGVKILLREWPPLFSRGLAGVAAALILAAVAAGRGEQLKVPREAIPRLLFAAFTNVFAWMGFTNMAMKWISVSEGALLVYTMPIWATLFAWPLLGTRPTLRDVAALALGVTGLAILFGGQGLSLGHDKLLGVLLALSSAILFALGNILNRKPIPVPPIALVAWQVGLGCLAMVVLGVAFEKPDYGALSGIGWAVMAYMTIIPMGICYMTWFETLRRLPPATASIGMLIVPPIGVVSAALILGEPLGLREVLAMAITLGGVMLALQKA
ncbi:multidrug DMT transporter permease [Afipia sp. Root123D2]|uniref:DMT family transporter n=1 Tax=Afipia sp. Root123D2 TaxID=1736436 RepID=UPI0006FF98B7|nr:DMT family transporter [Afipia sp. Root123D2]KQW20731.1 multidrug DMT transporter permease [Afipia sp. Root123D2]